MPATSPIKTWLSGFWGQGEGEEAESHWKDWGRKGRRMRETERTIKRLSETSPGSPMVKAASAGGLGFLIPGQELRSYRPCGAVKIKKKKQRD